MLYLFSYIKVYYSAEYDNVTITVTDCDLATFNIHWLMVLYVNDGLGVVANMVMTYLWHREVMDKRGKKEARRACEWLDGVLKEIVEIWLRKLELNSQG
jgi:hypothetical protein